VLVARARRSLVVLVWGRQGRLGRLELGCCDIAEPGKVPRAAGLGLVRGGCESNVEVGAPVRPPTRALKRVARQMAPERDVQRGCRIGGDQTDHGAGRTPPDRVDEVQEQLAAAETPAVQKVGLRLDTVADVHRQRVSHGRMPRGAVP